MRRMPQCTMTNTDKAPMKMPMKPVRKIMVMPRAYMNKVPMKLAGMPRAYMNKVPMKLAGMLRE